MNKEALWVSLRYAVADVIQELSQQIYHADFPELYILVLKNDMPAMIEAIHEKDLVKLTESFVWATHELTLTPKTNALFHEIVQQITDSLFFGNE